MGCTISKSPVAQTSKNQQTSRSNEANSIIQAEQLQQKAQIAENSKAPIVTQQAIINKDDFEKQVIENPKENNNVVNSSDAMTLDIQVEKQPEDRVESQQIGLFNIQPKENAQIQSRVVAVEQKKRKIDKLENVMVDSFGIKYFEYEGEVENGMANGQGTAKNGFCSQYTANFVNNVKQGKGSVKYCSGNSSEGEWKNDLPNGHFVTKYKNGDVKEGDYRDGKAIGLFTMTNSDDKKSEVISVVDSIGNIYNYFGQMIDGVANGLGTAKYENGIEYCGQFKDGHIDGYGISTSSDKSHIQAKKFIGQWQNDQFSGYGTYDIRDGGKYTGWLLQGKKHGFGVLTDKDGNKWECNWLNDEKHGFCRQTYASGETREGVFDNGKPVGQFINTKVDGTKWIHYCFSNKYNIYDYTGTVKNGHANGRGYAKYDSGWSYIGEFVNDKFEGYGTFDLLDKGKYTAYFTNDWMTKFICGEPNEMVVTKCDFTDTLQGYGRFDTRGTQRYLEGDFVGGKMSGLIINNDGDGEIKFEYYQKGEELTKNKKIFYKSGEVFIGDTKYNGFGTRKYANLEVFEGQWKDEDKTGNGIMCYPNGCKSKSKYYENKPIGLQIQILQCGFQIKTAQNLKDRKRNKYNYEGTMHNGLPHGYGQAKYNKGDSFTGMYVEGLKSGFGQMVFDKGGEVIKQWGWKEAVFHVYKFSNGDRFEGYCNSSEKDGFGIYYYSNGDIFKGEWKDNRRQGYGITYLTDGTCKSQKFENGKVIDQNRTELTISDKYDNKFKYSGQIENNKANGVGAVIYSNGDKYVGQFVDNQRQGHGIVTFANGCKLDAEFADDEVIGKGTLQISETIKLICEYQNGRITSIEEDNSKVDEKLVIETNLECEDFKYTGQCKDSIPNGFGTAVFEDDDYDDRKKYIGYFADNERNGFGVMFYTDGSSYEGWWKSNYKYMCGIKWDSASHKEYCKQSGNEYSDNEDHYFNGEFQINNNIDDNEASGQPDRSSQNSDDEFEF